METALSYEYLIRAVYQCGRACKPGTDADIYRSLERASVPYPGQKDVDQYKLGVRVGEVMAYLQTALCEIKEKNKDNEEFCLRIDKCLEYLYEPTLEKFDKCIEESWEAFHTIGLYA